MLFKNRVKKIRKKEIPEDRLCPFCPYAKPFNGDSMLSSGWTCYLDPEKPIAMGLFARHAEREKRLKDG